MDYRDHRPHLNAKLFNLISAGVGIRQSARVLGITRRCTELKLRKIGRHARQINLNLRGPLGRTARLHFDEFETFEGQRNTRPLTVPFLMESDTRFLIWSESARIRPKGRMTRKRLGQIKATERRHGVAQNGSRHAVRRTLARGAEMLGATQFLVLHTDEKTTYPSQARVAFHALEFLHLRTNSKVVRDTHNPLFPINHEETRMRDLVGRLRRNSWLASKRRRYLNLGLQIHAAYRNLVAKRFNWDSQSPAQLLGFVSRRLRPQEVLSWRQNWGGRSLHPLSRGSWSIDHVAAGLIRKARLQH